MIRREHMPEKSFAIEFDKRFYKKKHIAAAAAAFKDVAAIDIGKSRSGWTATVQNMSPADRDELEGEFCNYVFHLGKLDRGGARR